MPTALQSQAKTDKIVNYFADGTRQTVGYRVEEWTTKSKTTGPRARYDPLPVPTSSSEPASSYAASSNGSSRSGQSSRSKSSSASGSVATASSRGSSIAKPKRCEGSMLPPVVHTKKHTTKKSHGTAPRAEHLPNGWIHKEKYERYDYHQGVRQASYAVNSVTHKVDFVPPTPWDQVKDDCYAAKQSVKKWWNGY